MTQKVFQLLLSDIEKYFLWSAEASASLFSFTTGKICRKTAESPRLKDDIWDNVWKIVHIRKEKKDLLMNIKDPLMDYKKKFNIAAKNFVIPDITIVSF